MPVKTVAAFTLGCKVNQYDTDAILNALAARGCTVVPFDEPADLYIINTCTVTGVSDRKSRQIIRRAHKQNPSALIAVCGCYAQVSPDEIREIEGVDLVIGSRDKDRLISELAVLIQPPGVSEFQCDGFVAHGSKRTRGYIKIQEGCDRFCTYCIVPYARGPIVSRPPAEALAEAKALVSAGCREIVLTGIHVASYGKDLDDINLAALLEQIHQIDGLARVRLSSLEPYAIDDSFLAVVSALPRLCDHFHLSLQSGCDRTLSRMNRRYGTAGYAEAVRKLRQVFPDAALTTDIIVGFPGESNADFEESLAFAKMMRFSRVHVFEYSPKKGTPAASYPEQVPPGVKTQRSSQLRALCHQMTRDFMEAHLGQVMPVLFETERNGVWEGHTTNYMTVRVQSGSSLFNQIVDIRLTGLTDGHGEYGLIGKKAGGNDAGQISARMIKQEEDGYEG